MMGRETINSDRSRHHVLRVNSWRSCCDLAGTVPGTLRKMNNDYRRMPFLEGKLLVYSSLISVFLDAWYLYVPYMPFESGCLIMDKTPMAILVVIGSCLDVFGSVLLYRGSLFSAYMARSAVYCVAGMLSILPLPQVSIFIVLPPWSSHRLHVLAAIVSVRLFFLLLRTYISYKETVRLSGSFNTAAWAGAAFAATVLVVACNVFGAVWYNFSLARITDCLKDLSMANFHKDLTIGCETAFAGGYSNITDVQYRCYDGKVFNYGVYTDAVESRVFGLPGILERVTYCLMWAIQNMSSLGQSLKTSTFFWDALFVTAGVACFSLLVVTMQAYLQPIVSTTPAKGRKKDLLRWKPFYTLPKDVRKQMLRQQTAIWQETGEVNLENLLNNVTVDLRQKIKSHLCSPVFASVPVFERVHKRVANSLQDRLRPVLFSERTFIIQEGLPVFEMIFVVQGKLLIHSRALDGDIPTLALAKILMEGDVCGEELIDHVVARETCSHLPIAARTIQSLTKVEAFALTAWDLSYVVSRYRGLLFPSELETRAATTIQEAWRRYRGRITMAELVPPSGMYHG